MKMANYIPFYKSNLRLAVPVILSHAGQITVSLADNIMVGHVGTTELAAAAFANNVFTVGMFFGMGVTIGSTPLIGRAFGNNRMEEVVQWLKNGIFTHFLTAVVLSFAMVGAYFFLPRMGQPPSVLELAKPYYLILCASYLPFMLFFSMKQFFEGIGNTKIAMQITLISNVINIAVNYVLIYGKLGFPAMGLVGAGIGTLVARISMPLMYIIYILRITRYKNYFSHAHRQAYSIKRIFALLKIGIPVGFQIVIEGLTFSLGAVMMGWLGETPLAANQVAIGLASFSYMISLGIAQATTIRVSHQLGKNNYQSLKMAVYASSHMVLLFMMCMGLVFVFARNHLPLIFTKDAEVVAVAAQLLIVAAIFQVFDGLQVIMLSALRGMADVRIPMFMAFASYILAGIPSGYLFAFLMNVGPTGIWYGYLLGLGFAGFLFFFRFKHNITGKA